MRPTSLDSGSNRCCWSSDLAWFLMTTGISLNLLYQKLLIPSQHLFSQFSTKCNADFLGCLHVYQKLPLPKTSLECRYGVETNIWSGTGTGNFQEIPLENSRRWPAFLSLFIHPDVDVVLSSSIHFESWGEMSQMDAALEVAWAHSNNYTNPSYLSLSFF